MTDPTHCAPRRGFLRSLASLPLIGSFLAESVEPTDAASAGSLLPELISAHESAFARLERAIGVRNRIEEEIDEDRCRNLVLVPIAVMPNGDLYAGCCDLAQMPSFEIRRVIRDTHDKLRQSHCSKWSRVAIPEFVAAAERELDASQARALQVLADAEAARDAREQEAGLTAAQEAVGAAEEQEFEARLSLAVYAPRNAAEAAMKRAYIEQSPPFREGWCSDNPEFVKAMIARLGEPAPSTRAAVVLSAAGVDWR